MLMFQGWDRELESNRLHWARRWARRVPVVLVQPDRTTGSAGPDGARVEPRIPNCSILSTAAGWDVTRGRTIVVRTSELLEHMAAEGHSRPLLWSYNPWLAGMFAAVPAAGRVFHGTENYFDFEGLPSAFFEGLRASLSMSDLVLAVSPGVARSFAPQVRDDRLQVVTNGCDVRCYTPDGAEHEAIVALRGRFARTAIFGGNINERVDFNLLERAARTSPSTAIVMVGPVAQLDARDAGSWRRLRSLGNIVHLEAVDGPTLASMYRASDVGLIPYRRTRMIVKNGFPLKALEMSATGLPVVSTLMEPLVGLTPTLRVCDDDEEFLERLASTARSGVSADDAAASLEICAWNDYDRKFEEMERHLNEVVTGSTPVQTRIDSAISAIGVDRWREICNPGPPRADFRRVVAAGAYSLAGNLIPRRVRRVVPSDLRDSIRRRFALTGSKHA